MSLIINLLLGALAVMVTAYVLPGTQIDSFWTALVVSIVLGIVNMVLKPILLILTLPINILTLGLFTLVINALLILLVSNVVPGFHVDGLLWAIVFGLVLSLVNGVLHSFGR